MSGGTPVAGGYMRQRHSQGYASSGDDIEDDACSRFQTMSFQTPKSRTWIEVVENILWLASAAFIVYYGDRYSNMIYLLWHDGRIRRPPLYFGMVGIGLNAVIFIYTSMSAWSIRRFDEKWELASLSVLPIVTLLGLISFCLLSFALWPIWGFLTIPLLFTMFMAFMVVFPNIMIGKFWPQSGVHHDWLDWLEMKQGSLDTMILRNPTALASVNSNSDFARMIHDYGTTGVPYFVLDKCEVDISSGAAIPSRKEMERMIQPPLVDTTACLCRVDAGLKTVAGAKKFVPGSKLCLQPSIKPSIHPTRPKPTRSDRSRNQSPLLPGLPDDLAIACLIRVPRVEHRKLRLVCKRWYRLLAGNFFYSLRKSLGVAEEWIYVVKKDRDNKISWHAFDPIYQLWQPLPPVPREYSEALGFGCAVLSGCHLYLFGGKDPIKGAMRRVIFYSARTNKWHRAPDMLRRRYVFGSCVINNCLYVAGGENEGGHRSLRSAEVYDPNKNRWTFISDMSTPMVPVIGVVYEGKWYLKGYGAQRQVLSDVYQPETDTWCPVYDGMVPGWSNPSVSLNGHLYAVDCRDGCKLRVYDEASNSWNKSIDSKLHLGNSQALEAVALVPLNGKLCIVRNNMSISLVDVLKCEDASGASGEHLWETLAGKGHLKTLVTNLWSSLSGRSRLKSHIVHCQVLQA